MYSLEALASECVRPSGCSLTGEIDAGDVQMRNSCSHNEVTLVACEMSFASINLWRSLAGEKKVNVIDFLSEHGIVDMSLE